MKIITFTKRNIKEILRDPLSLVFCFIFPIAMLLIFQLINHYSTVSIPWFEINVLAPGMITFSLSFVMLYMAILISKDKTLAFLSRLYSSPMRVYDFVIGYMLPGVIIAYIQVILTFIAIYIISILTGVSISIIAMFLCLVFYLPIVILFVSLGILIGITFNDKAASGISSIVINIVAFLGGAWIPLETMPKLGKICKLLPFYPNVIASRNLLNQEILTFNNFGKYIIILLIYTLILVLLTLYCFKDKKTNNK